ncbi:MAG: hypothetical protein ACC645_06170 [Pirellulales bacterium]
MHEAMSVRSRLLMLAVTLLSVTEGGVRAADRVRLPQPILVTQLPARTPGEAPQTTPGGTARGDFGQGGRIVAVRPDGSIRVLTDGFESACDPAVSFDATRILFAGRRKTGAHWNIFELTLDTGHIRQITRDLGNCRSPSYQSTLYTIVSPQPWYQLTFVSDAAGTLNEDGSGPATSLYSCKLDGSSVRRLTYNLSHDMDPFLMSDGRILFAAWQRNRIEHGLAGRWALLGINLDGADLALYAEHAGHRIKQMPCVTARGLVVFIENEETTWDGSGSLGAVTVRRPLHSYRPLTKPQDGLFHSPSPLPDGSLLVSRRGPLGEEPHAVYRFEPRSARLRKVFDNPQYHDIQARVLARRREPDGRSSVVTEEDPRGKLYCLNVYTSDLQERSWLRPGTVRRIRVLEGLPVTIDPQNALLSGKEAVAGIRPGSSLFGLSPYVPRRLLGEVDVSPDGSFQLDIPANTPIELQTVDEDGLALRSCSWIWAKNHEPRGCIGCHEDGELTPENSFVNAMNENEASVGLPSAERRSVEFLRDIMPIVESKCVPCHAADGSPPPLAGSLAAIPTERGNTLFNEAYINLLTPREGGAGGQYVDAGRARTSPLMWHILGRNTSRPWDISASDQTVKPIPEGTVPPLDEQEQRTFAEWIDLGAVWIGPSADDSPSGTANREVHHP